MRTIRPQQYIDEVYPESGMCTATIINWIKKGKLQGTQTPTGRWLVLIDSQEKPNVEIDNLVQFLES